MKPLAFVTVALASAMLAACTHGVVKELPTAPSPVILKLTLTPVGGATMFEGHTAAITSSGPLPSTGAVLGAFAQYSNGSGNYVPANWTSSDSAVIAVDGVEFTAKGRGTATITASAEGKTASETFVVEPGIAGAWSGTYVVDECQAGSGAMFELMCLPPSQGRPGGVMAAGTAPPLTLVITRSGGSDLTASAQFGDLRGLLTGTDRGSNLLTFKGDLTGNATTLTLIHWDGLVRTDSMAGLIGFEVRVAGVPSYALVAAHLDKVTRR